MQVIYPFRIEQIFVIVLIVHGLNDHLSEYSLFSRFTCCVFEPRLNVARVILAQITYKRVEQFIVQEVLVDKGLYLGRHLSVHL